MQETNHTSDKRTSLTTPVEPADSIEKDADELVHEQTEELPDNSLEQDTDDLIHKLPENLPVNEAEETDADDLVHQGQNEVDEDDR